MFNKQEHVDLYATEVQNYISSYKLIVPELTMLNICSHPPPHPPKKITKKNRLPRAQHYPVNEYMAIRAISRRAKLGQIQGGLQRAIQDLTKGGGGLQ